MSQAGKQSKDRALFLGDVPPCIQTVSVVIGIILLVAIGYQFCSFWSLNQQITTIEKSIQVLFQVSVAKPQLQSQITDLYKQVNAISDKTLKDKLNDRVSKLNKHIDTLPDLIIPEKQISLEKDLIALRKDLINSQNTFYGSLVQTLGGLFFFVTAFFTWRNLIVSQEKQITERFSKAVDHLGSKEMAVRLGGIYELKRIANDSKEKDYRPTIEILTGFVRERSRARWDEPNNINTNRELTLPPIDIQSALDFAIELHKASNNPDKNKKLDLRGSDFSWMILDKYEFREIIFNQAKFNNADLQHANFYKADLGNTDFREAILNFANLSGVKLNEAIFSELDPNTKKPIKTAVLKYAKFHEQDPTTKILTTADFSKVNFSGLDFSGIEFISPQFLEAILENTKFVGAILENANFTDAILSETDFSNAILVGADFSNAFLRQNLFANATLTKAKLIGANLEEINLGTANLQETDLTGANLRNADLRQAINLTQKQVDSLGNKDNIQLPSYL